MIALHAVKAPNRYPGAMLWTMNEYHGVGELSGTLLDIWIEDGLVMGLWQEGDDPDTQYIHRSIENDYLDRYGLEEEAIRIRTNPPTYWHIDAAHTVDYEPDWDDEEDEDNEEDDEDQF